jgi:hypothetical protein
VEYLPNQRQVESKDNNCRKETDREQDPSSSRYPSEINAIRTAGRILLSGIGINKSLALSSTTKMPTTRFVNSGGVGQRGRTHLGAVVQRAMSVLKYLEKVLGWQGAIGNPAREDGSRATSNHLDAGINNNNFREQKFPVRRPQWRAGA